jgi:hypothetical protein
MKNNVLGKILRVIAIIFMAMTTFMNIMGGIGTSCAAFFTKNYPPYWILIKPVDYRWLYQIFVVTTLAVGIAGIFMIIGLIRGGKHAYRNTLIVLLLGAVITGIHYFTSQTVIGKAAPANVVFYINVMTLLLFLILGIPGIREKVNFSKMRKGADKATGGGAAAMVAGIVILTTPMWVGNTHLYNGTNWVEVLNWQIYTFGSLLLVGGLALLGWKAWTSSEPVMNTEEVQVNL